MLKILFQAILIFSHIAIFANTKDSLRQEILNAPEHAKAKLYNEYAVTFQNANWDSSLIMTKTALYYSKLYENRKEAARAYSLIGKALIYRGSFDMAESYLDSAKILISGNQPDIQLELLLNRGIIQEYHGTFDIALESYQRALSVAESINKPRAISKAHNSLGIVNKELGNYSDAEKHFIKALQIAENKKDINNQSFIHNNLGTIYDLMNDEQKAIAHYEKALTLNTQLGNTIAVAYTEHNMAIIFKKLNQFSKAKTYFNKSLQTSIKLSDKVAETYNLHYLASIYLDENNIKTALKMATGSLEIAISNKLNKATYQNYKLLSKIHKNLNNIPLAFQYFEKYAQLKDSIFSTESQKRIEDLQNAYQKDRMQKKLNLLEKEQRLNHLKIEKSEAIIQSRNIILIIISATLMVMLIFGIILYRQIQAKIEANRLLNTKNEEINQQNEEIRTQRDQLEILNKTLEIQKEEIQSQNKNLENQKNLATTQRDKIITQNQSLTDNIAYASRIQKALLPFDEQFKNAFAEWFILNRPQTIVGGDFYWVHKTKSQVILSVVDCTGHGVTGGFISILGIALLNDIVVRQNITSPDKILNELRKQIITLLHQDSEDTDNQDGMDISIICFDRDKKTYQFAGANQRIYIVNNQTKQLTELVGNKMPISIYKDELNQFTSIEGAFTSHDIFYLFTDGFPDQFGGRTDRKFLYKNFKKLLIEHCAHPLDYQHEQIVTTFYEWKGMADQIDDVLIVGVKP